MSTNSIVAFSLFSYAYDFDAGTKIKDITNLIGFNWRLTELQAAIGLIQLKAINTKVKQRARAAERA